MKRIVQVAILCRIHIALLVPFGGDKYILRANKLLELNVLVLPDTYRYCSNAIGIVLIPELIASLHSAVCFRTHRFTTITRTRLRQGG